MAKLTRLKGLDIYVRPPIYYQQKKGACRAHCTYWLKSHFEDGGKYLAGLTNNEGFTSILMAKTVTAYPSLRVQPGGDDSAQAVELQDKLFAKSGGPRPTEEQRAAMSWGIIHPGKIYGGAMTVNGLDNVSLPKIIANNGTTYRCTLLTLSEGVSSNDNPLVRSNYTHHAVATFCGPAVFSFFDPSVGEFSVTRANAKALTAAYWGDVSDPNDTFKWKDNTVIVEHTSEGFGQV